MIKTTLKGSGRADNELACPNCSRQGLWQPLDREPCWDAWWCRDCCDWVEPVTTGPTALCYQFVSKTASSGDEMFPVVTQRACA